MKIGPNIFTSNYYSRRSICNDNNINILKFMYENNICINNTTLNDLILLNDFEAIKYCVEIINIKITIRQLINLFYSNYNNKSTVIFKYFYDKYYKDISTNAVMLVCKSLLSMSHIFIAKKIFTVIKYILHKKHVINANLLKYAIIHKNYEAMVYFNKIKNVSFNKIIIDNKLINNLIMNNKKNRRNRFIYRTRSVMIKELNNTNNIFKKSPALPVDF